MISCRRRRAVEVVIVGTLFIGLTIVLGAYLAATAFDRLGDTATLYQMLESIPVLGYPTSSTGLTSLDAFLTWGQEADQVCAQALVPSDPTKSLLTYHSYLILYPLSLLTLAVPAHVVVPVTMSIVIMGALALAYVVVRRAGGAALAAFLFCVLAAAHPYWSMGITQNYYPDRYFLLLGLLQLFLLHDPLARHRPLGIPRWTAILAVGLLAALTNDRALLYVSGIYGGILVFYWFRLSIRDRVLLAAASAVNLAGFVVYTKLVMDNVIFTNLSVSFDLLAILSQPETHKFLFVNFIVFGALAWFDWRLALLALGSGVPNILANLAGVEKTGFYSHYHVFYFTILLYATARGCGTAWAMAGRASWLRRVLGPGRLQVWLGRATICLLMALGTLALARTDTSPALASFSGDTWRDRIFPKVWTAYTDPLIARPEYWRVVGPPLLAAVPVEATVSTLEGLQPLFYRHRLTTYYPINLDDADYVVLRFTTDAAGRYTYQGAISYRGENAELDGCLTRRMARVGYDVDHPTLINNEFAVVQRRGREGLRQESGNLTHPADQDAAPR